MNQNDAFILIRQLSLECTNQPSIGALRRLRQVLGDCDEKFLQSIQKYVVLPLQLILNRYATIPDNRESIVMETCSCLRVLFAKTKVNSFDTFAEVYVRLFCLSDGRMPVESQPKATEDLKSAAVATAQCLLEHSTLSVIEECVTCLAFRQAIGHSISVILDLANNEPSKALKTEALRTLYVMLRRNEELAAKRNNSISRDVFASFLPGISISVLRLMTSDDKFPQKLITSALECIQAICCLCLANLSKDNKQTDDEAKKGHFAQVRNHDWAEETSTKLETAFKKFVPRLMTNTSPLVQLSLLKFSQKVLSTCCEEFVVNNLDVILEIPLVLLSDTSQQKRAQEILSDIAEKLSSGESRTKFQDSLLEKCYVTVSQLPRSFRMLSEEEKLVKINLLAGLFRVLGADGVNSYLTMPVHRQRLFQSLVDISEFEANEFSNAVMPEELKSSSGDINIPKKFKHFNSSEVCRGLENCCRFLASIASDDLLVDMLSDHLSQSCDAETVFVCNLFLKGCPLSFRSSDILGVYIDQLAASSEEKIAKSKSAIKICLIEEGVVLCTRGIDRESFLDSTDCGTKVLYDLLRFAGNADVLISEISKCALWSISKNLGYPTLLELIYGQLTPLSSKIVANLEQYASNIDAPVIVNSILALTDGEALEQVDTIIDHSLQALDMNYNHDISSLLTLLQSVIRSCQKCAQRDFSASADTTINESSERLEKYRKRIEQFVEQRRLEDEIVESTLSEKLDPEEEPEEQVEPSLDEKPKPPFYVLTTKKILERCVHLMSDPEPDTRIQVMDMVQNGVDVMRTFEDELLPLAHKLWSPLIKRFQDEVAVMRKAFATLLRLSEVCGDFLRARTQTEVLPKMVQFLRKQLKESSNKNNSSGYRFTTNYQLQLDALVGIGPLARRLDVQGRHLWPLLMIAMEHTSLKQPQALQEAAEISLRDFVQIDAESVWFYANSLLKKHVNQSQEFKRLAKYS